MTFAEKRLRVIARRASRRCATRTIGHGRIDGKDAWLVTPWSRIAVESVILDAIKSGIRQAQREGK